MDNEKIHEYRTICRQVYQQLEFEEAMHLVWEGNRSDHVGQGMVEIREG